MKGKTYPPGYNLNTEPAPYCYRCGQWLATMTNQFCWSAVCTVTFMDVGQPDDHVWAFLCDECTIAYGEFMVPDITNDPSYISDKDQYDAMMRELRKGRG